MLLALLVARLVSLPPMLPSVFLVSLVITTLLEMPLVHVLSVLLTMPMVVLLVVTPRDHSLVPLPNGLVLSLLPVKSFLIPPPLPMVFKTPPLVSSPHVTTDINS